MGTRKPKRVVARVVMKAAIRRRRKGIEVVQGQKIDGEDEVGLVHEKEKDVVDRDQEKEEGEVEVDLENEGEVGEAKVVHVQEKDVEDVVLQESVEGEVEALAECLDLLIETRKLFVAVKMV